MNVNQIAADIQENISNNQVEEAIEILKINLITSDYYNEILTYSGKFKQLKKQKRLNLLSYEEALRIESRIIASILELVEEIKKDKNVRPIIRGNQKWGNDIDLRLDISVNLANLDANLNTKSYKTLDFADANDFLTEVYLEVSEYFLPKTYGKDWVLIDSETNEELTYPDIEERIMQEKILTEKFFDDTTKCTDFTLKKINTIHNKS